MPLPDANKRSPRVYTNLQNIDLDTVTFANVQDTGNPIAIEELNEDEMRRLVLVNLARLVCAGEWNGLLSAGGGTQYAFQPIDASLMPSTYTHYSPMDVYRTQSTTTSSGELETKAVWCRFVSPKDGTMGEISLRTGLTQTGKDDVQIGIYESSGGLPTDRIGIIDIDVNGGADIYTSSSWTTAPTITGGDTYWIGFASTGTTRAQVNKAALAQFLSLGFTHYAGTGYNTLFNNTGTDDDLPSTVDLTVVVPKNAYNQPVWTYKYA